VGPRADLDDMEALAGLELRSFGCKAVASRYTAEGTTMLDWHCREAYLQEHAPLSNTDLQSGRHGARGVFPRRAAMLVWAS
jgi:hypothetical protein